MKISWEYLEIYATCICRQAKSEQTINSLLGQMPAEKRPALKKHLYTLRRIVDECMGYEETPEVVEHASLFLFWLLLEQCVVTVASTMRIRSIFGTIFGSKLACIHQCIGDMRRLLEDYEIEQLRQWNKTLRDLDQNKTAMWGEDIQLDDCHQDFIDIELYQKLDQLNDWTPKDLNLPTEDDRMIEDNLQISNNNHHRHEKMSVIDQLKQISFEMDLKELPGSISELLNSNRSNNELQNVLIELLGFHHFDLVQQLLMDRDTISMDLAKGLRRDQSQSRNQKVQRNNLSLIHI